MEPMVALGFVMLAVCALGLLAIVITLLLDLAYEERVPNVFPSDASVWPMDAKTYSRRYGVLRFRRRR